MQPTNFTRNTYVDYAAPAVPAAYFNGIQNKLDQITSVTDFGAVGDGVTDDYAAVQAALTQVNTNGGILYFPVGTFLIVGGSLSISDGSDFVIAGAGMYQSIIKRGATDVGTVLNIVRGTRVVVRDLGFDGGLTDFPGGSASHGFVFNDCEHVRGENLYATNFFNGGVNAFVTGGTQKRNIKFVGCEVDGLSVANNGINIANCIDSGIINCNVRNCPGSPGYGLQLKNICERSYIKSCTVEGCVAGVAFGNDIFAAGVERCMVSDVQIYNCEAGIITGYASDNIFDTIEVDMNDIEGWGIDLQNTSANNVFRSITGRNINSLRSLFRIRSGDYNTVDIAMLVNTTVASATLATIDSGVQFTRFNLGQVVTTSYNPWTRLLTDNSGNNTNVFTINGQQRVELHDIASGAVTLTCGGVRILRLGTEGGGASDDLDTITGGLIDNQLIYLQTSNNAQDVVVRDNSVGGGNIDLVGGTSFTLANIRDSIVLMYKENHGRWVEVSRATVT